MSQAQLERFYQVAAKDQNMLKELLGPSVKGDTFTPEDFVRAAVAKAKELGYEFSYDEADAWIKKIQSVRASGELDDAQLESVAGGKWGNWDNTNNATSKAGQQGGFGAALSVPFVGAYDLGKNVYSSAASNSTVQSVVHWFSSW